MGNCDGCCESQRDSSLPSQALLQQSPSCPEPDSAATQDSDGICVEISFNEMHSPPHAQKKSSRRLSWTDMMGAGPISVNVGEGLEDEVAEKGALNVQFGILRQSNLYGCFQALPDGATGADIVQPVPKGVTVEVRDSDGSLGLWITFESESPGRCQSTFMAKLKGNADPADLTVNVCANVMSIEEGRPSSKREGVQLIQRRTPARFSVIDAKIPLNEGMMWEKGKSLNEDDPIDRWVDGCGSQDANF